MKIDRSKLKKSSSEVPTDCRLLIERLKVCVEGEGLLKELRAVKTWNYGKSELYHWIDVLDLFDSILEKGVSKDKDGQWSLPCDSPSNEQLKDLLIHVVVFTSLLIEHSFSRHLYNSMEHLTTLLSSSDMQIVLAVLNLLYVFSKRSNFISRLNTDRRQALIQRLNYLAESWGGKENGFGLAECCQDLPMTSYPNSATNLHFEFYADEASSTTTSSLPASTSSSKSSETLIPPSNQGLSTTPVKGNKSSSSTTLITIHVDSVDQIKDKSVAQIMEELVETYGVPKGKQMLLFTHLRLAHSFSTYKKRLQCVQARLQALSIIVYCNAMSVAESNNNILYNGFIEELVDVLELKNNRLLDIKAAALRTLTSVIHLDHSSKLSTIIDVTGAGSYHGFLPSLVRSCIQALIDSNTESFPLSFATALFSFLYHLASYENGGEALVSCGMIESLLKVIGWKGSDPEHITFVTRAVRVIDLITNLDMAAFQTHNGLSIFISRLESEVDVCRSEQPFFIDAPVSGRFKEITDQPELPSEEPEKATETPMEVDSPKPSSSGVTGSLASTTTTSPCKDIQCYAQRAALLKSMLNFLKKAIQDSAFSDSIRHLMDGSLPNSLRHVISNAEYYGPSLFMLATDVVTVYVFQEPSLLSTLQESGLTDVVLQALLGKDIPPTREVVSSLPNVFTALCLNTRGLQAFQACKPFDKVFKVLLSLEYLPAMRRRRSSDPMGDTAGNLGSSMDELMRHQPSLRADATAAIIKLLEELCVLGSNPKYICSKSSKSLDDPSRVLGTSSAEGTIHHHHHHQANNIPAGNEGGSSDEDDEEEEETTNDAPAASSVSRRNLVSGINAGEASDGQAVVETPSTGLPNALTVPSVSGSSVAGPSTVSAGVSDDKQPIPLVDYIVNVMRFTDSILSNNSTDDHCREFVKQKGLTPLLKILLLPNLPIDFPMSQACLAVAQVSKSILTLAHERQVLNEGLNHLTEVLARLQPLEKNLEPPGGSVLLEELLEATAKSPPGSDPLSNASLTPLLHAMSAAHSMIVMFVHVCRTGQSDVRNLSVTHWGNETGIAVLTKLSQLYTSLVWESTVLLALCSESTSQASWQFGKHQLDKLTAMTKEQQGIFGGVTAASSTAVTPTTMTAPISNQSSSDDPSHAMEVDEPESLVRIPPPTALHVTVMPGNVVQVVPSTSKKSSSKTSSSSKLSPQVRQIKPLLSSASRLGRALAELFGLLVKLCVGTPIRHRRNHHQPNLPLPPSPAARSVAVALTKLLARGLSWVPPSTSPIPKFRLTFYICSVGFTSPMLFDERKFPYHLMLQQFVKYRGQEAFFDTFKWALTQGGKVSIEDGIEHPDLPDGTGEFLDSWLLLLEKMINPKTILESPHALPTTATTTFVPFDPVKYLIHSHKKAFECVMHLWNKKPLRTYGERMSQSVLTILCHLLKGESVITDKLQKEKEAAEAAAAAVPGSSTGSSRTTAPRRNELEEQGINVEHLQQLTDMGFARELALEALMQYSSLEQATDFLLSHPAPSVARLMNNEDIDEEEAMRRAMEMSLGQETTPATVETIEAATEAVEEEEDPHKDDPMPRELMDNFTKDILTGCLQLLDTLPETVYRVCDLLIAVSSRNGDEWLCNIFRRLIDEILVNINRLIKSTEPMTSNDKRSIQEWASQMTSLPEATRAATRLHVFTLLFEEKRNECAHLVSGTDLIETLVTLLERTQNTMSILSQNNSNSTTSVSTPKWLAPVVLLIDLYDKAAVASVRRAPLLSLNRRQWKWFDDRSGKWTNYTPGNNKTIDDAYKVGESVIRFTAGRRKYTIQFGTMVQVNEETGSWRPIMFVCDDKTPSNSMDTSEAESSSKSSYKTVSGLQMSQSSSLIRSCVGFISVPVEADTLHAVMRLCLRLTRNYDLASSFADLGGVRAILSLTQKSAFAGFNSLASLIIRHILEEPVTLKQTMEKVIRSTVHHSPTSFKEMNYILRVLGPASCREKDMFTDVVKNSLRVQLSTLTKREEEDTRLQQPNAVQILKLITSNAKTNTNPVTPSAIIKSLICDLLNSLTTKVSSTAAVTPIDSENKDLPGSSSSVTDVLVPPTEGSRVAVCPAAPLPLPEDVDEDSENASSVNDPFIAVSASDQETFKNMLAKEVEAKKNRPLMTQSSLLRLLAELSKSYSVVAKIVTEYSFHAGQSDLITDDCSSLAFILDNLLPSCQSIGDKDCPALSRVLISALSSCNHCPEAQTTLVSEVKSSLSRSLLLTESAEKHNRIQALANVMYTMIESCPPSVPQPAPQSIRNQSASLNNIVKIMLRKGVVTDLARVTHSLDLSSPHMSGTINSVMKPLELLSRIVNTPSTVPGLPMASSTRRTPRSPFITNNDQESREEQGSDRTRVTVTLGQTIGNAINAAIVATLDRGRDNDHNSAAPAVNGNVVQDINRSNDTSSEVTNNIRDGTTVTDVTSASDTHAMDDVTDNDTAVDDAIAYDLPNNNSVVEMIRNELDAMDAQLNETLDESVHHDSQVGANVTNGAEISDQDSSDSDDDEDDGEDEDEDDSDAEQGQEEDHEEDDDNDEDQDDEDDDEEGSAMMDELGMDAAEARIMGGIERGIEEDILLDLDEIISPAFRDLASGLIPMIEHESVMASGSAVDPAQPSIPQNPGTVSVSHPLLIRGHSDAAAAASMGISSTHAIPGTSSILASSRHGSRIPRSRFGRYTVARDSAFWHHHSGHVNAVSVGRPPAGAILHTLLGSSPRDVFAMTGSSTNPRLVLTGNDFQIIATDEMTDYVDAFADSTYIGTSSSSNNTMGNIPSAMLRWTEESRVLDGDSMHDCVASLKPDIIDFLEQCRDQEILERKEKRKKLIEDEEKKNKEKNNDKRKEEAKVENAGQSSVPSFSAPEQLASNLVQSLFTETLGTTASTEAGQEPNQVSQPTIEVVEGTVATTSPASPSNDPVLPMESGSSSVGGATSNASSHDSDMICNESAPSDHSTEGMEVGVSPPSLRTPEPVINEAGVDQVIPVVASPHVSTEEAESPSTPMYQEVDDSSDDDHDDFLAEIESVASSAGRRLGEAIEREIAQLEGHVRAADNETNAVSSDNNNEATVGQHLSETSAPPAEVPAAASAVPTTDPEIPEGVDPSFLAALPESIRREVIAEQLRLQRQRTLREQQAASGATAAVVGSSSSNNLTAASGSEVTEINAEFLAALPPNIQEEVLAQQRLERERQAAATANPDAPVDPANFIQTLPPSLRRQVLADMDDSQIALLPGDLATEAQSLRNELETRQRQIQERFFTTHAGSTLSRILRSAETGLAPDARSRTRYAIHNIQSGNFPWNISGQRSTGHQPGGHGSRSAPPAASLVKFKGRQLLDHEAISCLLILLFVDEPKLNVSRLHRVLRNLCQHTQTRQWVIQSLLTIMERTRDTREQLQESTSKTQRKSSAASSSKQQGNPSASWLSISLDAALGCKTNVFQVQKPVTSKKHLAAQSRDHVGQGVTIHPQAAPLVSRHVLDALISLAKAFPHQFLSSDKSEDKSQKETSIDGTGSTGATPAAKLNRDADFWDVLVKLDSLSTSRKGKSVLKSQSHTASSNTSLSASEESEDTEAAPLRAVLQLLSHPVIRRSAPLTDRLLRLLSLISLALPSHEQQEITRNSSDFMERTRAVVDRVSSALTSADTSSAVDKKTEEKKPSAALETNDNKPPLVGEEQLRLAVEVLISKSCSEEGLEDVNSLLLRLSRSCPKTRDIVLKLLLSGAQQVGHTVQENIDCLYEELRSMSSSVSGPSTSGTEDESSHVKGVVQDRFTREKVVITAPNFKPSMTSKEVQLPSMATLTSKTSSQSFFLRILKVIIQLRDSIRSQKKKKKESSRQSSVNRLREEVASVQAALHELENEVEAVGQGSDEGPLERERRHLTQAMASVNQVAAELDQAVAEANPQQQSMEVDPPIAAVSDEPVAGPSKEKEPESKEQSDEQESLSSQLLLESLWKSLSRCLLELADAPDHHAVLVLQPAVEAFFLVHASEREPQRSSRDSRNESRENQLAHINLDLPPASPQANVTEGSDGGTSSSTANQPALPLDTQKFLEFAETHKLVLNQILRQSTTPLVDGPFAVLVDHTRVLDFDVKRRYFRQELERLDDGVRREDLAVHVRREHVFEDSFRELYRRSPDEWKNRFYIVFEGEEGQDAGGLLREWYTIISREIFNPMYALFTTSPGDRVTYMINPASHCNSNHLSYFKFVGRVISKAIYDNKLLECYFTRSFYKHILGKPVKYHDMESEDYSFYQGLVFLLDHDIKELGYELTFSVEVQEFGVTEVRDLKPNGRNIPVTEDQKHEYVRLVCQEKMTGAIRQQLNAFLDGFYEIIPKRLISIFNEQETELLLSGLPNIDIDDLKGNTEYHKYQSTSLQIQWFWRALRSFDQADRAKFLQFVTGTSKVPLQGFASLEGMNGTQKFQIHRDDRSTDRLPSAHTCFNQLDLPAYETYDKLKTMLLKAVRECSEGFGFA